MNDDNLGTQIIIEELHFTAGHKKSRITLQSSGFIFLELSVR